MLGGVTRMTSTSQALDSQSHAHLPRSLASRHPLRADRRALACAADHDLRHGLEMGGGLLREGGHLLDLDRHARVPVAAAVRVPRPRGDRGGCDEARRRPGRHRGGPRSGM